MLNKLVRFIIGGVLAIPNNPLKDAIRDIFYGNIISERIIEYPLIFALLGFDEKKKGQKILDVGCYYSNFPIQLASMGFKTWGIDLAAYQLKHPNFTFVQGDIQKTNFSDNFFDVVTSVSTIEHIGIGYYGDKKNMFSDKTAVKEIARIIKVGGKFLATVPYSKKFRIGRTQRFYDKKNLTTLLKPEFKIEDMFIFQSKNDKWFPANEKTLRNTKGEKTRIFAAVCAYKTHERAI